jgi:Fe-S-cluster containining protein
VSTPGPSPCQTCGACCAQFRVSFYWAEGDDTLGGWVPIALTQRVDAQRRAMRGTLSKPVRCVALKGELGQAVSCGIYAKRPSPCREFDAWLADGTPDERCQQARARIGLPVLHQRE